MENNDNLRQNKSCRNKNKNVAATSGSIYGLAFIGSVVYYIQHAHTFWMVLLGILKALVWPAVMIYKFMEFIKM